MICVGRIKKLGFVCVVRGEMFCVKCFSVFWLGVRDLGRGRPGMIGKVDGSVCVGKWVWEKRLIV